MVGRQYPAVIVVVFRVGRREAGMLVQYSQKECLSSMMSHMVGVKCRLIGWFVPFAEVEMTATAKDDVHEIPPSPLLPSRPIRSGTVPCESDHEACIAAII